MEVRTRVVNRHTEVADVYIGRGSDWGNPFVINLAESLTRERVIELYATYIRDRLVTDVALWARFEQLRGKVLGCYCKPQACHGDVLVSLLEDQLFIDHVRRIHAANKTTG